jgi:hypothetical protein
MFRTVSLMALLFIPAWAITSGYVSITTDSLPAVVYLDGTTVEMSSAPRVVEAEPGKHFVSLFPPQKVYQAEYDQAPEHFWDKLRSMGVVPDRPGLLSTYEAGAVSIGTQWVYVTPEDTTDVRLSQAEVAKTYRRDTGCVTRTFIGWTILFGLGTILSVALAGINAP